MGRKLYSLEDIIHKLREADVLLAQGKSVAEECKSLAVTVMTYYRWQNEYSGLQID